MLVKEEVPTTNDTQAKGEPPKATRPEDVEHEYLTFARQELKTQAHLSLSALLAMQADCKATNTEAGETALLKAWSTLCNEFLHDCRIRMRCTNCHDIHGFLNDPSVDAWEKFKDSLHEKPIMELKKEDLWDFFDEERRVEEMFWNEVEETACIAMMVESAVKEKEHEAAVKEKLEKQRKRAARKMEEEFMAKKQLEDGEGDGEGGGVVWRNDGSNDNGGDGKWGESGAADADGEKPSWDTVGASAGGGKSGWDEPTVTVTEVTAEDDGGWGGSGAAPGAGAGW